MSKSKDRKNRLAKLVSLASTPPIVTAFTFLVILSSNPSPSFLQLMLISLTFGTILPLSLLYLLTIRGMIPDIYAPQKETRVLPFAGTIASYAAGVAAFLLVAAPSLATALMLCYLVNTLTMMTISFRWKISIHASGIAGPATLLAYSLGAVGAVSFLLLLPVGWARVKLGAHTTAQILAGAGFTFVITWIQLRVYLLLL